MEDNWNVKAMFDQHPAPSKEHDVQQTLLLVIATNQPLLGRISSYKHLVRITAWILQFANNAKQRDERDSSPVLSLVELKCAKKL